MYPIEKYYWSYFPILTYFLSQPNVLNYDNLQQFWYFAIQ